MGKRRKLYYAPGMISLLGLLLFLPRTHHEQHHLVPLKTIPYNVPNKSDAKSDYIFSIKRLLHDIKGKTKLEFLLTDDRETNAKKLEMIRYEARKLYYTFNTNTVIFIKFTPDFPYGDFVKLLNICNTESIKRYAGWDDCFVIFGWHPYLKRQSSAFISKAVTVDSSIQEEELTPEEQKEKQRLLFKAYTSTESMCLFGGWFLLLISYLLFRKSPHDKSIMLQKFD